MVPSEVEEFLKAEKLVMKSELRSDLINMVFMILVTGGLAFWAFGTVAHAFLFAVIMYAILGIAHRLSSDSRRHRMQDGAEKILDRLGL